MELDTAPNILRSATTVNAEPFQQKGQLGTVAVGAYATSWSWTAIPLLTSGCSQPRNRISN